jgi:hypothetical protein
MTAPVRPTNEEIEARARAICAFMGLDPDETVFGGDGSDGTAFELKDRHSFFSNSQSMPRWRKFRNDAFMFFMAERTRP